MSASIDTTFITNYNQLLSGSIEKIDNNFNNTSPVEDFEKILHGEMKNFADIEISENQSIRPIAETDITKNDTVDAIGNIQNAISKGLNSLNEKQVEADRAAEIFATGGDIDVHDVMIAAEKASLSMQLALQTRNKLMAFYNEIKNMNF